MPPPCSLCHHFVKAKTVRGTERGGLCVWFGTRVDPADVDDEATTIRTLCLQEGDHFIWRMQDLDPLASAQWRKTVLDEESLRRDRRFTRTLSVAAIVVSVAVLVWTIVSSVGGA